MNKETFSRYGWIIIIVLILAVMITFAAPFGNAIALGVNNFVNGFGNAMNGNTGGGGSGSSGIKLDAPTNLTLANNQLSFDLVPNANQYILYVNDEVSATYAASPIDVSTYIESYEAPIEFKIIASDSTGVYGNSDPAIYNYEGSLEWQKAYALKTSFTNEELASLYALGLVGGTYSELYSSDTLYICIWEAEDGIYGLGVDKYNRETAGGSYYIYATEEAAALYPEDYPEPGWYYINQYTSRIPVIFEETGDLYVEDLDALKPLIDLRYNVADYVYYGELTFKPNISDEDLQSVIAIADEELTLFHYDSDDRLVRTFAVETPNHYLCLVVGVNETAYMYIPTYALADLIEEGIFPSDSLVGWYNYGTMEYLGNEMSVTILETDELGVTYLEDMLPLFELHECSYTQEVEADQYLKEAKLCPEKSIYYHSCACGAKGNTTFEAEDVVHNYVNNVCTGCGALETPVPGLYQTGSNYTILIATWDELLASGELTVENGSLMHAKSGGKSVFHCSLVGDLYLPTDGSILQIAEQTFQWCNSITGVIIPESVTTIGEAAFAFCTSLTDITIPKGVTTLGRSAFNGCTNLASVTFANGSQLTTIEEAAFFNCTSLKEITIPASVASIASQVFYECASLTSVTFEKGSQLTAIDKYTFEKCASLEIVNLGACFNLTTIGERAFDNCTSLKSITLPASVTAIDTLAFRGCTSLVEITLPDGLTAIGASAFSGCTSLASVTFENTEGWWYALRSYATSGTALSSTDLADPSTAATYLASIYNSQYWFCK